MCLFPPTRITEIQANLIIGKGVSYEETTLSGGFRFIGDIGVFYRGTYLTKSYSIDTSQLFLQIIVASLAGVVILYALNEPQKKD